MDGLGLPPGVRVHPADRSERTGQAGIVHQHGYRAERFPGVADGVLHRHSVGHIRDGRQRPAARSFDFRDHRFQLRAGARHHRHLRSGAGQFQGDTAAEATAAAGHQRRVALQVHA